MNDKTTKEITINGHEVKPLSTWVTKNGEVVLILDVDNDVSETFPIKGALYWDHDGPGCYWWRQKGKSSTGGVRDLLRPTTIDDAIFATLGKVKP